MQQRMTTEGFRRWLEDQPEGQRFELDAGAPVAISPERVGHALLKAQIWKLLERSVAERHLPCQVLPDGITVEIGDDTSFEPDAIVNCGPRLSPEALAAPSPLNLVEVLSRSTRAVDTGRKFACYFSLPSLRHFLIISYDIHTVIHHRRLDDGTILTRLLSSGRLDLDPPGVCLDIDEMYRLAEG
jgi:Uma2 family endonuclease